MGRSHRYRGGTKYRSVSLWDSEALPLVGEPGTPLSSSVIDFENFDGPCDSGGQHGTSGPDPPYGTSSGLWVILPWRLGELFVSSLAHELPGGIQAQDRRRRPMQAWVSCSGGRTTACDPHAFLVAISVVSSVASYLKHSATTATRVLSITRHPRNPKEAATDKSTRAIRQLRAVRATTKTCEADGASHVSMGRFDVWG